MRGEAPAPVAESVAISLPALAAGGGGSQGGGDGASEESRANFIYERRLEFIGSCLSRGAGITHGLEGGGGWGLGLPRGFRSCTEDDPERSRLSPWRRTGKKSARDACYSSASPKGQRSPENFRECTRVGVCSSLPKCRESALKVRHVRRGRTLEGLTHQNAGPTPASGRECPRRPVPRGAGGRVLPLLTRSRAGVFIAKPRRSRALRRVVAGPFRARISAGSPPEVSQAPGAPSCSHPGAFPGHSSSQSAPCLRALKMPEAPRRPAGARARRTGVGSRER